MTTYTIPFDYVRPELELTQEQVDSVPRQGVVDSAVEALAMQPSIFEQTAQWSDADMRRELDEYGAWDEVELADRQANIRRLLWLSVGDVQENRYEANGEPR